MAATFVQLTRADIENWLNTFPAFRNKWKLADDSAGIYLLPLSENVAIKFSSTVGRTDDALGRANASAQFRLVSLKVKVRGYYKVINGKAQGQRHFARTTNWAKNWRKGIDRMQAAYVKAAGFYERIALEGAPNQTPAPKAPAPPPKPTRSPEQEAFLKRLDALEAATQDNDFFQGLLKNVRRYIENGWPLTAPMKVKLREGLTRYRVGEVIQQNVARRYMSGNRSDNRRNDV